MSGGFFNLSTYQIREIWEDIEWELDKQGKEKNKEDLYYDRYYYDKYPEEKYYETYPLEIQEKFREAIQVLKKAEIYTHAIDYYLSGDYGDESFLNKLKTELDKI